MSLKKDTWKNMQSHIEIVGDEMLSDVNSVVQLQRVLSERISGLQIMMKDGLSVVDYRTAMKLKAGYENALYIVEDVFSRIQRGQL